jgi:hypothetical protein
MADGTDTLRTEPVTLGSSRNGRVTMRIDSLGDLETKGFVVVRGFLDPAEVELLRADHAGQTLEQNDNFHAKTPSAEVMARLTPRFDDVLAQINERTGLRADVYVPETSVYFAVGSDEGVNFPWHQDHESFFMVQNHYDYVNFWLPIVKPDPVKSNICVVPFDVLQREEPKAHDFLVGNGAGHFQPVAGRWIASNDERGGMRVMHSDLEQLAVTPHMEVGDLLLMRGDIIHRTQDADTQRVALSWRAASGATVVSRSLLASGGVRKAQMMRRHMAPFQKMFDAFDRAQRDELPLGELLALTSSAPAPEPVSPAAFTRRLFAEKRRAHVLGSYLSSVPMAAGLKSLHVAQQCSNRLQHLRRRAA